VTLETPKWLLLVNSLAEIHSTYQQEHRQKDKRRRKHASDDWRGPSRREKKEK